MVMGLVFVVCYMEVMCVSDDVWVGGKVKIVLKSEVKWLFVFLKMLNVDGMLLVSMCYCGIYKVFVYGFDSWMMGMLLLLDLKKLL